jgi:hypothetical protein
VLEFNVFPGLPLSKSIEAAFNDWKAHPIGLTTLLFFVCSLPIFALAAGLLPAFRHFVFGGGLGYATFLAYLYIVTGLGSWVYLFLGLTDFTGTVVVYRAEGDEGFTDRTGAVAGYHAGGHLVSFKAAAEATFLTDSRLNKRLPYYQ